ncbi:MAG TPA: imidazole glycerol phosphate synthase subunit HisH [Megamonas hypermegale]|uniref:Imidazole glycerol phosphate synthase subunit HisH n=1 Tax=Megamonas hypermegale TaxID=158847 RepID=A0A921L875_9FIRM|nr:imidazole glycerol phosphate synthase subunit HisH [Megamonas hypermegale]HJF85634.1 imidazole glycerol phosphate synthase subunit HisH [Megamonas hypermegale]
MIAIVDYGVGNLYSVEKAFARFSSDVVLTHEAEIIDKADKVVLPGVGAFGDCMKNFKASGLVDAVLRAVKSGKPVMGICVGLQIMFEGSDESPGVAGLGIFKGRVRKINAPELKIPHMGWNSLTVNENASVNIDLFKNIRENPYVYFVHSYYAVPEDKSVITAKTVYGEEITAAVGKDNVIATQFHPEKSGDIGLSIIKNFVEG